MKFCGECGALVGSCACQAMTCPCGRPAVPGQRHCAGCADALAKITAAQTQRKSQTDARDALTRVLLTVLVLLGLAWLIWPAKEDRPESAPRQTLDAMALADVMVTFSAQGARVEQDPQRPDTIRIYLPDSVTAGMTREQGDRLASITRGKLGDAAVVYIKDSGGSTVGKAGGW